MPRHLRIVNARVYDPANGVDGVVRDLLIADGKMVDAFGPDVRAGDIKQIDGTGLIAMPGGVDIHCHIASSSINRARAITGEEQPTHVHSVACAHGKTCTQTHHEHRDAIADGLLGNTLTPSTFTTGLRYAALGYTTAVDAAVAPSGARHTTLELEDTPNIDSAFLLLLANHHSLMQLVEKNDQAGVNAFVAHMLRQTGAYGIKVVNPGGVESWRSDPTQHIIETLDSGVAGVKGVTPRKILEAIAGAAEALNLPHAPHVHCNRLGMAGNVDTTLETIRALQGRRMHLTHLQYHAYGKSAKGALVSGAQQLMAVMNASPSVTADVGQVVFGQAVTLTGDTPLEYLLWQMMQSPNAGPRPYFSVESELEGGCGVMPIAYSDKNYLHSMQWAIGLELMLTASDPWRMLLSTDHPNGGSFMSYPLIIASLMSKAVRDEQIARANPRAMAASALKELTREMTLSEIAIVTRAGPARVLGLRHKGQLSAGADADITLYDNRPEDPRKMFESPRCVIKGGELLVEDGHLRRSTRGVIHRAEVSPDERGERLVRDWFAVHGSYDVGQFGLSEGERAGMRGVRAG
jgi:formylmethanofuran dehydrogenase subunit A